MYPSLSFLAQRGIILRTGPRHGGIPHPQERVRNDEFGVGVERRFGVRFGVRVGARVGEKVGARVEVRLNTGNVFPVRCSASRKIVHV